MQKPRLKKLSLNKETLQVLTASELQTAAGGLRRAAPEPSMICSNCPTCPTKHHCVATAGAVALAR